jgi:hypothetical protein
LARWHTGWRAAEELWQAILVVLGLLKVARSSVGVEERPLVEAELSLSVEGRRQQAEGLA